MLLTPNPCPFLKGIDGAGEQQHLLLEGELPEEQMERLCPGGTLTPPATKMSSALNRMEKMKKKQNKVPQRCHNLSGLLNVALEMEGSLGI